MNSKREQLEAIPVEQIKICISKGNRKIGRVMNVSLPPILSCANCAGCSKLCYDVKACMQYPNTVIDARMRNYVLLMRDRARYFALIEQAISKRQKNKFFRWHVAGDIVDIDYFDNMVRIAREHSDFIFWTYTKNYAVVNAWIAEHGKLPRNFTVMFSEWRGMPMNNPHGMPEFRVVFKDEKKPVGFYCPGNCDVCKEHNCGCVAGQDVYCMEH
jgi:hypothetical protein